MNIASLVSAYHKIIEVEYKKIVDQDTKVIKPATEDKTLTYDELKDIVKSPAIIEELRKRGFLVNLKEDFYRSLHIDVAVRSANIKTYYGGIEYIVSPRLEKYYLPIPSKEDRKLVPRLDGDLYERELNRKIDGFFNNREISEMYKEIISEYFGKNGGLDTFQLIALTKLFSENTEFAKKSYVISAPTGAGKTEVFLLYALAKVLKKKAEESPGRVLLTYPRKALAVDQTSRVIRLVHLANKIIKQKGFSKKFLITLGIRDGETPKKRDLVEQILKGKTISFRGIHCPLCDNLNSESELVYKLDNNNDIKIVCTKENHTFEFIVPTREELGRHQPDFLVSNMWAVEWRLVESKATKRDINVGFFEDLSLLIVDEAHEYTGLSGGLVSALIKVITETSQCDDFEVILSSATLPSPRNFAKKLTQIPNVVSIDFQDEINKARHMFQGKRLVLMGVYDILPMFSWNTYSQLWAILMAFINYVYSLQGKEYLPQSLIFIENIKEIRRALRGVEENISLGEPKDHIITITDPFDPYSFVPYIEDKNLLKNIEKTLQEVGKLEDLLKRVAEIHSEVPPSNRHSVIAKLKAPSDLGVVFSTSTLEVGVDYGGVSFILNSGFDNPISLRQRIGRGGRSLSSLRTVLGIILTKKIPTESFLLHDINIWKKLDPIGKYYEGELLVSFDNPQILKRYELMKSLVKIAQNGKKTYSSGAPIKRKSELISFLDNLISNLGGF